ncbi:MAG: DUF2520 domain-containing protein [Bacteroidales bacterium]|nr:DUF2520 domain-containing protein [Bacteroidales bacterium]
MQTERKLHIALLGACNVGYHLAHRLAAPPVVVTTVYSRSHHHATEVAALCNASAVTSLGHIDAEADIYLFALADKATEEIAATFRPLSGIVVHTSGSLEMEVLASTGRPHGVLYPLQTFSRGKTTAFEGIPLCTEASDDETLKLINQLAAMLSGNVHQLTSHQRKQIHLAAVFACNFSNFMYVAAADILRRNQLDFDILLPLVGEFFSKLNLMDPWAAQTGPAMRGDHNITARHVEMLREFDGLDQLYDLISKLIEKRKNITP